MFFQANCWALACPGSSLTDSKQGNLKNPAQDGFRENVQEGDTYIPHLINEEN
jgi:hypothetical protein